MLGEKCVKVFIVDSDDSFRQKTRALLESAEGITVVGEAKDGRTAVAMIRRACPDVALLDVGALHTSGPQTARQIRELFTHTRIIVLNGKGQEQLVLDALGKGALGHLVREKALPDEIVAAVRAVGRGEAVISPGVAGRVLDQVMQERKLSGRG